MAAGDVNVQVLNADAVTISAAVDALRVTANDKWLLTDTGAKKQVILVHIEEA